MPQVYADVKFKCTNKQINELLESIHLHDCEFGVEELKFLTPTFFGLRTKVEYRYDFYARNYHHANGHRLESLNLLGNFKEEEMVLVLEYMSIFKSYALVMDFHKIRDYSISESNSLSRRLIKTTEELGELAEAILCVEDPNGTSYKKLGIEDVKEESVDVLLMVLSIFFDKRINGTMLELATLVHKKCCKWYDTSISKTKGTVKC